MCSSDLVAAPLNAFAQELYRRLAPWLERLERDKRHPDDEPISLGSAEILIVGMGRVGSGAYEYLRRQSANIVGVDSAPAKIESNIRAGRRVAYADMEDPSFWQLLNIERLKAIMLAVPDMQAKLAAARALRARGFKGLLSATHLYPEEYEPIIEAGCDVSYNYYTEAGVLFVFLWAASGMLECHELNAAGLRKVFEYMPLAKTGMQISFFGEDYKITAKLKQGISQDQAKKINKLIKDEGPKSVKTQTMGEEIRVTSKSRDDLQDVIALIKGADLDFATQFVNYR